MVPAPMIAIRRISLLSSFASPAVSGDDTDVDAGADAVAHPGSAMAKDLTFAMGYSFTKYGLPSYFPIKRTPLA